MEKKYLTLTFADENQKRASLRVNNPKDDLDETTAKQGADSIVQSGVFRAGGRFTAAQKGELVTVTSNVLFGE